MQPKQFIESLTGTAPTPKISCKAAINQSLDEAKGATAPATHEKYKLAADEFLKDLKATDQTPLLRNITSDVVRSFPAKKRTIATASTTNL